MTNSSNFGAQKNFRAALVPACILAIYLAGVTAAQVFLLEYCFEANVATATQFVIALSYTAFFAMFALGYAKPAQERAPNRASIIVAIAFLLQAASAFYVGVSAYRIFKNWDFYSQGPAATRFLLAQHRNGISGVGFLHSIFLGAPSVFVIFVSLYLQDLKRWRTMFAIAAIAALGMILFLASIEGSRLGVAVTILSLISAVALQTIRERHELRIKPIYLISIAVVSVGAFFFAYKETANREAFKGRNTVESTLSNYQSYIFNPLTSDTSRDTPPN